MRQIATPPSARALPGDAPPSGFQIAGNAAERYEQAVARFMLGWSEDLVASAGLRRGERVVDVACGTGFVTRIAATQVGDSGHVIGVDINAHIVAEAKRVTGLEIIEASAESTGLTNDGVDVVLCQQGIQYVPDPDAVLREAHRLLRPGGRIALSVWSELDRNPFRVGQLAAMRPHLTDAVADAYRRTSIASLGGLDGMVTRLHRAAFVDITVEEREREVWLPPMRTYFPELVAATPWKDTFDRLTIAEREAVLDRLDTYVDDTHDEDGCTVRMTVVVATGQKSRATFAP